MSFRMFTLLVLVLLIAVPTFAQVDKAAIEAVALDQSKAPLPGVTVTVARPETGFSAVAVTDTSGIARFLSLAPGNYSVEFTLEGFAPVKEPRLDRKSTRLNSSHPVISYAGFCLKKKTTQNE